MSYYTVKSVPFVVGNRHYATRPGQPVKLDDDAAAPLVAAGTLEHYPPRVAVVVDTPADDPDAAETVADTRKPRRRRAD
ncbi:hypothetical protein [Mycolicibacterium sp.]|uniref:hypothetical protein n=1 Tax=Mycolicibacterium sp. TaxID=2320850 RepID=UPI0025E96E6D|nr:hypothetical protein [Mycolicibacterium sp.]